jgi:hypothetical protein
MSPVEIIGSSPVPDCTAIPDPAPPASPGTNDEPRAVGPGMRPPAE